jgi:hypothetical protein
VLVRNGSIEGETSRWCEPGNESDDDSKMPQKQKEKEQKKNKRTKEDNFICVYSIHTAPSD